MLLCWLLLRQAEGLRLAIDDEHDYRGKVAQPPPSLTSLLELKRSLQDVLSKAEAAPQLDERRDTAAAVTAKGRGQLSTYGAPLPQLPRASQAAVE